MGRNRSCPPRTTRALRRAVNQNTKFAFNVGGSEGRGRSDGGLASRDPPAEGGETLFGSAGNRRGNGHGAFGKQPPHDEVVERGCSRVGSALPLARSGSRGRSVTSGGTRATGPTRGVRGASGFYANRGGLGSGRPRRASLPRTGPLLGSDRRVHRVTPCDDDGCASRRYHA